MSNQKYAWQKSDWTKFTYNKSILKEYENQFLYLLGKSVGVYTGLSDNDKEQLKIEFLSEEAYKTSQIEGELLDRESLQSSLRRFLNLEAPQFKDSVRENGIAKMMIALYTDFSKPLTKETLCSWHSMLMNGRIDIAVGKYREHLEPMEIVSSRADKIRVFYQAPPSEQVEAEMQKFILWFNRSHEFSALIKAGIAHLYFELIHPFEDGNGRIGRALIEKTLAQSLGQPSFIAISQTIQANRKNYYQALEEANQQNEMTDWLVYFSKTILEAQKYTIESIEFLLKKTKLFGKYSQILNDRQKKLISRIFAEGIKGFRGGVSIQNYISLTKTSRATATRDLTDLVSKNIMRKTGELKSTRYSLL